MAAPKLGEDGVVSEAHPLPEDLLPTVIGLRKQAVVYSCLDASQYYLVVGSTQGYVWVVDLKSKCVLKEFNEFKGAAITVVKLNPVKDCVAYATDSGFVRVERVTRTVSTKWRAQERSNMPVSALEWSPAGDNLYVGFTTGRVLQFHLQFPEGSFFPVQFPENYGSRVVQLSASSQALLVSTEQRALLVDVETHKLDQVGRKDRKVGLYGGVFVQDGSIAYLARPGLRLWVADNLGKVSHTVAFKEHLSTKHLPAVHVKSLTSLRPLFSRSWQFGSVHLWILDRFVLTFHENTLFILDPEEGNIVGVLSLQCSISGLAAAGGQIFVLCRVGSLGSIVRLSVHPSLVKLKSSPFLNVRHFVGNLSAASSRSSSREALDQLHMHTMQFAGQSSPKPELCEQKEEKVSPDGGDAVARFEEQSKPPVDQEETEKLKPLEGQVEREELKQPGVEGVAGKLKPLGREGEIVGGTSGRTCGSDVGVDKTVSPDGEQVSEAVEKDDIVRKEICVDQEGVVEGGADVHVHVGEKQAEEEEEEEGQVKKKATGESGVLEETKTDKVNKETNMAAVETTTKLSKEEGETDEVNSGTSQESSKQSNVFTTNSTVEINSSVKPPQNDTKTSPSKELESESDSSSIPDNSKGKSIIPALALVHGITHVKVDLKEIKGALKLGKLTEFISQATSHSPILQLKTDQTTFSVGSNEVVMLPGNPVSDDKEDIPTPVVVDPEEQQRWLRMAETAERDEDVVVATKSPSKARKTRKRRTKKSSKHSSATSSKSVSMEQLYEPDEEEEAQRESDIVAKINPTAALPSLSLTEQQEAELNALEEAQLKELTQAPETKDALSLEDVTTSSYAVKDELKAVTTEIVAVRKIEQDMKLEDGKTTKGDSVDDMGKGVGARSAAFLVSDASTKMPDFFKKETVLLAVQDVRIEQESGQEMIDEEVGGATDQPGVATYTNEPTKEDNQPIEDKVESQLLKTAVTRDMDSAEGTGVQPSRKKERPRAPLFDDDLSDPEDTLFGSSSPSHNIHSITTEGTRSPDYSNPVYQDSDEEDERKLYRTGREWLEEAAEFGHRGGEDFTEPRRRQSFLSLQPTACDPLQSDEYEMVDHENAPYNLSPSLDHTLAHARYSSSPEQPRMQPQSLPCLSEMTINQSPPPKYAKTGTTSPVLSKFSARGHMDEGDKSDGTDSSHESENEAEMDHSEVVADWYKLCGGLVQGSRKTLQQRPSLKPLPPPTLREEATTFEPVRRRRIERVEQSLNEEEESSPHADIWVPIPHPSRHNLQSMSLSDKLLWVVDTRWNVYCTTMESRGRDWQNIKRNMSQISSSPSGKNVWGIYRHNAYVRLGIGMNPEGSQWRNITKNTHLAHRIKQLAVDENAVWAISTDGKVLFRKDVGETMPEGKVWQEVTHGSSGFSFITCCQSIVWAITSSGKVFCRTGITPSVPSGRRWADVKTPKFVSISITTGGVVWGVSQDNSIGFRCGVSPSRPSGKGQWWEVCINALNTSSSPFSPLWHVMSPDGNSLLTSVSSFVTTNLPTIPGLPALGNKVLSISASSKSGVVVLETGSRLHACWRSTTGFHYSPACKQELFQFMSWSKLAAGGSALWLVRADDGDLYSLAFGENLKRIECPAKVDLLAASPSCMWIVSNENIWSRQALTVEVPEGISFDYIELSTQLQDTKLRNVACGKRSVWAVDTNGVPHFRFGVHAREPGTGMSPAWIPVEDNPHPLLQIAVSPDDWLVWACDVNYNVYVRSGVTLDFPVGRTWELIPGEHVKELCASNEKVYALSQSGELLCRYGISERNIQGNYWRKMPGKYEHITVGEFGELWTMDTKGQVWRQEWKVMTVSSEPTTKKEEEFEKSVIVDHGWEML